MRGRLVVCVSVVSALLLGAPPPGAGAAPAPEDLGAREDTAAGSCWEIKQERPEADDGAYWLLTPAMSEPGRFYCDMTTDGGGWVLVGKGRGGWKELYEGKGDPAALETPETVPMSNATVQLPAARVDELLNGGRVDALPDGVRLRRATSTDGSSWQEVRFSYADRDRWVWTMTAEHPFDSYAFDGETFAGDRLPSFGNDNAYERVNTNPKRENSWKRGWAFGNSISGSTSGSAHLWVGSNGAGNALPYTTVWLRPQVTSDDPGFTPIPDGGTPAREIRPLPRATAVNPDWGVAGIAGSTSREGSVEVQAFTETAGRMIVGGNFRYVQQDESGTGRVEQPFLAAFDVETGEWLPDFRPELDEQVRALATLPSGDVVAGGDFSTANGEAVTGVVALDPTTGASVDGFTVVTETRLNNPRMRIRALDVQDGWLYLGGRFTHVAGGDDPTRFRYMRMLGRVAAADGRPDPDWRPELNGPVAGLDATEDGNRVYAAGNFSEYRGADAFRAVALSAAPGADPVSPAWQPVWSNPKNYQQAVRATGGKVFVGGSEHSLFQWDTTTFERTATTILNKHGDIQAIDIAGDNVFAGCHCRHWSYQGATTWAGGEVSPGWSQADAMGWVGAWDADTGERLPDFTPTFTMRLKQGIWAVRTDSRGTLWAGGDVVTVRVPARFKQWSGGFARFPQRDSTAAGPPSNLSVTSEDTDTVSFSWSRTFDQGGGIHYQVMRDDRVIATTVGNVGSATVPKGGDNRFFVRAIDAAGNLTASTPVLVLG